MPVPWKWITSPNWKSHGVPVYLVQALLDDLRARQEGDGEVEYTEKDTVHCAIDQPGMVCMDRPWMTFQVDGLTIEIPCEDVLSFYTQLKNLPAREFTHGKSMGVGMTYYKLHAFHKCLVLTPDVRQELLDQLGERAMEAEVQATAFYADRKLPSEVLREAAAAATDTPLDEIPNLGANRQDRFKKTLMGKKGDA